MKTSERNGRSWAAIIALLAMALVGRLLLDLVRAAMGVHDSGGLSGVLSEPDLWLMAAQLIVAGSVSAVVVAAAVERERGGSLLRRLTPAMWIGGLLSGVAWFMLRDDPANAVWPLMLALLGIAAPTILEQALRWWEQQEAVSQGISTERAIRAEISIGAPAQAVWDAWTTPQGIKSFFAPDCRIDPRPDGAYEIFFDLESPEGQRGSEGCRILALQPPRMLSFTWNAPPGVPEVRGQRTHVTVRLDELSSDRTVVTLLHDGWGEGPAWDEAYRYFQRVWPDVVLPRLRYRFVVAEVDWDHAPGADDGGEDERSE